METIKNTFKVTRNSFNDDGDGVVSFPNGLTISDDQIQRNGSRYDITSLDISKYAGQLTADHKDELRNIIGRVEGVKKKNGRVSVDRIVYAVRQNPYARLAYDLLVGGFSKAFSTETIGGPANDTDGTLKNHELVGLSQVVTPNNYSAVINTVRNSLQTAKNDGLDINGIEEKLLNEIDKEEQMDNTKETEDVKVEELETLEETPETEVEANEEVKNEAEKAEESVEEDGEKAEEPETEEKVENKAEKAEPEAEKEDEEEKSEESEESDKEDEDKEDEESKEESKNDATEEKVEEEVEKESAEIEEVDNEISDEQVAQLFEKVDNLTELVKKVAGDEPAIEGVEKIVKDDINEVEEKVENKKETNSMNAEEVKNAIDEALKGYFANQASAPEFKKEENSAYADLDWKELYNKQVNSAYEAFRLGDVQARKTLNEINAINLNKLKEANIVKNSMTIASMGNFVIPPEMYKEMVGKRTDYTALINATEWKETKSLEFAWLKRSGDIDMQNVAMCDDGHDGNLKPTSEYQATPKTSKLEEMAAVTVVCNAATRFFAVDLLSDVAAGYRNDYDRKRAQLIIAKLEEAVAESGYSVEYAPTTDTEAMIAWLKAVEEVSDTAINGTLIFNARTFAQLKAHALEAGVDGPLSHLFTDSEQPQIFGTNFIVVPNDLMPTIESEDEISFIVNGETVKITHSVFYADLSEFIGFTSGGLQYDISTDASYEVNGTTRSAYQRNELVLRGSFFRGGAIKDSSRVAGILRSGEES